MSKFHTTETYGHIDRTHFGGIIYAYDYDSHLTMTDMAFRILQDQQFDEQCRKDIQGRNRKKRNQKELNTDAT